MAEAYLRTGRAALLEPLPGLLAADLALLRAALIECRVDVPPATLHRALIEAAGLVNAHLPQPVREGLWKRLGASTCRSASVARTWLSLHAAIASEDAGRIVAAADALLRGELSPDQAPYVVAAHMSGLLRIGTSFGRSLAFGILYSASSWARPWEGDENCRFAPVLGSW
jgi:hypothetical protein